jgi:DNA-binding CsgD family transcriptional regulator
MTLSDRQLECIVHLANGMTMLEISATVYVSEGSVKQSLASARKKMGAKNNCNLVSLAVAKGLIFWSNDGEERTLEENEKGPPEGSPFKNNEVNWDMI